MGNTNVKKNFCWEIVINYEFDTEKEYCKLIYINPNLGKEYWLKVEKEVRKLEEKLRNVKWSVVVLLLV